jgi:hypothetical protein
MHVVNTMKEIQFPEPSTKVTFYEHTIRSMTKNKLRDEFFDLVNKSMDEGYKIKYMGLGNEPKQIDNGKGTLKTILQ